MIQTHTGGPPCGVNGGGHGKTSHPEGCSSTSLRLLDVSNKRVWHIHHGLCTCPITIHLPEVCVHLLKMGAVNIKVRTCEIGQNQQEIFQRNESEMAFMLYSRLRILGYLQRKTWLDFTPQLPQPSSVLLTAPRCFVGTIRHRYPGPSSGHMPSADKPCVTPQAPCLALAAIR